MKDKIIKIISENKEFRCCIAKTTNLVENAKEIHNTSKTATAALGRLLTANLLMAADLKRDDNTLSLQIRGNGPGGNIITYANGKCEVKGYVSNPEADLPIRESDGKIDVGGFVGKGASLTVVRDLGLKEPYTGTIEMISGEIAEDLTYYFVKSEQIPTAIALGVLVDKDNRAVLSSGGIIIQMLPDAGEETISMLEKVFADGFSISRILAKEDYFDAVTKKIFKDISYEVLDEIEPVFKCDCSKERFERGIISLGKDEIKKLSDEKKNIFVNCHFCNKSYEFTTEDISKWNKILNR